MNTNINQIFQKVLKNLSVLGVSLSIYNTVTTQSTVQTLRNNLEDERIKNSKLIEKVNNLILESESNSKVENIVRKSFENNDNKIEILNNKVNQLIENKSFEENKIMEINNSMKDINKDLIDVLDKIDETLRSSIIDIDIINSMISYINSLNYFQSLAISHLFLIMLISILLIDLMGVYFSDYLITKINIKERYPRIYKLIELTYINIKLFLMFTL